MCEKGNFLVRVIKVKAQRQSDANTVTIPGTMILM
jgi:hypothetical protein